ncbi:unnamed protein product [Orchesella dallaii]|uniref:Metalloendopeptidase n=1 Tax=Orchesella dallaii TaxID=48710 RepID=A0ABP1PKF2_9HEXA
MAKLIKNITLTCASILIFYIPNITARFSCQTPDPSDSIENLSDQFGDYFYRSGEYFNRDVGMSRWENNIVKYSLDGSLTANDRKAVSDAIEEYHTKTCLKFEPKESRDRAYVHIEIDNSVCGYATGYRGRRQVAQMGQNCRDKHTMVHELGHIIGLDHEHQRRDRGDYINYRRCKKNDPILRHSRPVGFYDYQSVMHYSCGSCLGGWPTQGSNIKCGEHFNNGLSVLDADHINSMYECGGCKRHRWRPANQLTSGDRSNLHSFGYTNSDGQPIYPCRSLYQGQVVLGHGSFSQSNSRCYIIHSNRVIALQNNVEVLTIPGGLRQQCHTYKLTSRSRASVGEGIPVAAKNNNAQRKVYIAYGTGAVRTVGEVATAATNSFVDSAQLLADGNNVVKSNDYKVLTCSCSSGEDIEPPNSLPFLPDISTTVSYPRVIPRRVGYGSTPNAVPVTTATPAYVPITTSSYPRAIPRQVYSGSTLIGQTQPSTASSPRSIPRQVSYGSLPTRYANPTTTSSPRSIPRQVSYGSLPTRKIQSTVIPYIKPIPRQVQVGRHLETSDENSAKNEWSFGESDNKNFLSKFLTDHFHDELTSNLEENIENNPVKSSEEFDSWWSLNENGPNESQRNSESSEGSLSILNTGLNTLDSTAGHAADGEILDTSSYWDFLTDIYAPVENDDDWFAADNLLDDSVSTKPGSQNIGEENSFSDAHFIEGGVPSENIFDEMYADNGNEELNTRVQKSPIMSESQEEQPDNYGASDEQSILIDNWW